MSLADFSVRRAVAASMMVLIVLVLGAVSYTRIPVDIMPDMTFPVAMVFTEYEGVGPEEMENTISRPLEESLSRVDGIKNLYSTSQRGVSSVLIEFDWGTNMDAAVVDVREKIDQMPDWVWPEDADRPRIQRFDPSDIPLMAISMYGEGHETTQLQRIAETYLQDPLVGVEGVASVMVFGGPPRQVLVAVDQDRLAATNIPLQTVMDRLHAENYNLSAGSMKEGHKDYLVRAIGEFHNVDEIENVVLGLREGGPVRLSDVAVVMETFAEPEVIARDNQLPSALLMFSKQSGSNTVEVSARVWERIAELQESLPVGVHLTKTFDTADFINEAIQNVRGNLVYGGALAILVLALFLRQARPIAIIAVAIPISLLTALIPMYFLDTTINMMSLGGLALATGMLVDNAIVVLENIFRRLEEEGESRLDAARRGGSEVTGAIAGSTLTTIVVFLPIAFTQGFAARLFRDIALTVTFSLAASFFTAVTLVPMLASRLLRSSKGRKGKGRTMRRVNIAYRGVAQWVIAHKWRVFIAGNLIWILSLGGLQPILKKEFMPTPNDVTVMVAVELPRGVRIEETNRIARQLEAKLSEIPEILSYHALIGLNGQTDQRDSKYSSFILSLSPQDERERDVESIIRDLRAYVSAIPGVEEFNFVNLQSQSMGGGTGKPIEIKLFGRDLPRLVELSNEALRILKETDGVVDPDAQLTYGNPEVQVSFDRERAAQLGMPVRVASTLMETAIKGTTASRYRKDGEEYDIVVRLQETDRDSLQSLKDLQFVTPAGTRTTLSDFASVDYGTGPTLVYRENQTRAAVLTCGYDKAALSDLNNAVMVIQERFAEELPLPSGYYMTYGGEFERMEDTFTDLGFAAALAILLVYMIMAALFESTVLPFAIMFSVPVAFAGSWWGLLVTGTPLSAVSGIGTILLAGIVVNNGIVLIDYANQCRRGGMVREQALLRACVTRLRPILMTNLTTILALVPMAMLGGAGAEMRTPLAISVMGGLTFGVMLTLVLLPATYLILDDLGSFVGRQFLKILHGEEDEALTTPAIPAGNYE